MEKSWRSGKIFMGSKYRETVLYDVCSNDLHVTFDGRGGIADYSVVNRSGSVLKDCFFSVFIDGEKLDPLCAKRVELVGRMQRIVLKRDKTKIEVCQFVAPGENGVFYEIKTNRPGNYEFVLDLSQTEYGFHYDTNADTRYIYENKTIYLHTRRNAQFVLSYDTMSNCARLLSGFSRYRKQVESEIRSVRAPATAKTEKDTALYVSSIFCALENYKEIGLYKGFSAGGNANAPVRTYFRDAYWTALSMMKDRPRLVRNQILTLGHGIGENGDCPDCVTADFRPRVLNFYDSPSFFVLLVYDYINHTGDLSVLDEVVNRKSVCDLCFLAVDRLAEFEDKTGLLVKVGRYNKLDWADEVNRTGYATYVELLYARALFCLSRIAGTRDAARARRYREMFDRTKYAINTLLWNDEKGYYINYRDGSFVEDNLSIDTILAVLFGIADKSKTERLLDSISALLDTRNNRILRMGNFGLMCVYPCYRGVDRCSGRSIQPYEYQNGAVWPYWSALVAYAQMTNGRDHTYALTSPFLRNIKEGRFTPIEYYSPFGDGGDPLHAKSSAVAWVYDWQDVDYFKENEASWEKR